MIAIDLSEKQTVDVDPKPVQQINFIGNINRQNAEGQNVNTYATMFFNFEESKETILDLSDKTAKVLWICSTILFCSNIKMKTEEKNKKKSFSVCYQEH